MNFALTFMIVLIVLLLIFSAFFSGSETALTAVSRARILHMRRQGSHRAALVEKLIVTRDKLIGGILLGNNLVNILASSLATSLFLEYFGPSGVVYASLVMTALVVVFAEVLPKTYAIGNPDRMALAVAPLLKVIVAIFAPITLGIQLVVRRTLRLIGAAGKSDDISLSDELRGILALRQKEGDDIKHDRDMLGGLLDLQELEVSAIMVHRTQMNLVQLDAPVQETINMLLNCGNTRLPVWKDEPDNIIGVLHAKDLLKALNEADGDVESIDLRGLCAEPWFVPETTGLRDQLNAFLRRKTHFAIVVDEYGEVQGLITLEDILEEIVGEIADEHDVVIDGVRPLSGGAIKVDGATPIRDLNRAMDWMLPDDQATTVAGLVIHEAQTLPETGQAFTFYGFRFEILKRDRNRITSIRITPVRD
ncbi:MAG: hypothetical protein C0605_13395 [Hyphomicrobiales bacterium]|nr:MAG: hypothetical protein C0605_13395 [Hyphomicrobiales bacterium]